MSALRIAAIAATAGVALAVILLLAPAPLWVWARRIAAAALAGAVGAVAGFAATGDPRVAAGVAVTFGVIAGLLALGWAPHEHEPPNVS